MKNEIIIKVAVLIPAKETREGFGIIRLFEFWSDACNWKNDNYPKTGWLAIVKYNPTKKCWIYA